MGLGRGGVVSRPGHDRIGDAASDQEALILSCYGERAEAERVTRRRRKGAGDRH
jgi:hypothetical protein